MQNGAVNAGDKENVMIISHLHDKSEKKLCWKILDKIYSDPRQRIPDYNAYCEKVCKYAEFICAKENSEIIGFIAFYANDCAEHTAYITQLDVLPKCQNMGVGAALIDAAEDISRKQSMKVMRLEVRKDNAKAIRFYMKHGYMNDGGYTDKSYYMSKNL